jgi:hypothetical protein
VGRKENRTSKPVQILEERTTDKAHIKEIVCLGNRRDKDKDLGMEGTRTGRETARKIFERGARSGQRSARLHSEGRV